MPSPPAAVQALAKDLGEKLPAGTVESLFKASLGEEEGQIRLDYFRCRCARKR